MSAEKWYIIKNIRKFLHKTRVIVYNNFGKWDNGIDMNLTIATPEEKKDLESILPLQECKNIVLPLLKKQKNQLTNKTRYVLSEDNFLKIIEDLNLRMVSNLMSSLVSKGLIETAYDEKANDFVFWVKDNENKKDSEKPETD